MAEVQTANSGYCTKTNGGIKTDEHEGTLTTRNSCNWCVTEHTLKHNTAKMMLIIIKIILTI
jgi:hypothetical protein